MEGTYDRRKRIRRLKKIILGTIAAAIVIPVILSLVLGIRVIQLQNRIRELEMGLAARTEEKGEVKSVFAANAIVNASQKAVAAKAFPENTDEVEEDINEGKKQVYLTFDDGPSANTDAILDILREYNVKATFFVVGEWVEKQTSFQPALIRKLSARGIRLPCILTATNMKKYMTQKKTLLRM